MRILCTQKWKEASTPTMEEWMEKLMELREMEKLIKLIKEKNVNSFVSTWKLSDQKR